MDKMCLGSCRDAAVEQSRVLKEVMVANRGRNAEDSRRREKLCAYGAFLKGCTERRAFAEGRKLHEYLVSEGIEPDVQLGTALISFYARFGRMRSAREVFDKLPKPDILAWNMMIAGYAKRGPAQDAFQLFDAMMDVESGCRSVNPNEVTFVGIITAAANTFDLDKGKQIHMYMVKIAFAPNIFMNNAVVDMYAKCGCIQEASRIFNRMAERDTVSWNTMIGGLTKQGFAEEAFAWYALMRSEGVMPNEVTLLSLMNACANSLRDLELARQLHFFCQWRRINHGEKDMWRIMSRASLANALIDMYCKCGSLKDAGEAFDSMSVRDEIAWNAMIGGHAKNGHGNVGKVWMLCERMKAEGLNMNEITILSVLNACATIGDGRKGERVHACIQGDEENVFVCSALVDMYGKCGNVDRARKLFDRCTWSTTKTQQNKNNNIVLWTAMISGYARHGRAEEAFRLFFRMDEAAAAAAEVRPNEVTFVSLLDAVCSLQQQQQKLEVGRILHSYMAEQLGCCCLESNNRLQNALIHMYAKCGGGGGGMDDARRVFERMSQPDPVSWTSLIAGYAKQQDGFDMAFWLFGKMMMRRRRRDNDVVKPDGVTFVTMSNACANVAALEHGRLVHVCVVASGIAVDAFVGNSLIDMYAKCGSLKEAQHVLRRLPDRDMVTWNTILSGCAQYGSEAELVRMAKQMQQLDDEFEEEEGGGEVNQITILSLLSAMGRSGSVSDAIRFFVEEVMVKRREAEAAEHYACIVDMVARAGNVEEAAGWIARMPFQPTATGWAALLGACNLLLLHHHHHHHHQEAAAEVAESAAEQVLQLEPHNSAAYVVLSNIYCNSSSSSSVSWN